MPLTSANHLGLAEVEATVVLDEDNHPLAASTELKADGQSFPIGRDDMSKFFEVSCKKYLQQQIYLIYIGQQ
jgi:hypothetical protein